MSDEDEDTFDWTARDSVVVPTQQGIAVYENPAGEVVLRQQRDWDRDEDWFICVSKQHLPALIEALKKQLE